MLLAGCGSTGQGGSLTELTALLAAQGRQVGGPPPGNRITATDAELRAIPVPLLTMEIPSRDTSAGLLQQAVNRGDVTWITPDGNTVTLRGGLVVATRGLGADLMSAEVPDIRAARGQVVRDHYRLDGDARVRRQRFFCEVADGGPAGVTVTGIAYATRLLIETCREDVGDAGEVGVETFTNRYWIEPDGLIRQSRQYVSPAVGDLVIATVNG